MNKILIDILFGTFSLYMLAILWQIIKGAAKDVRRFMVWLHCREDPESYAMPGYKDYIIAILTVIAVPCWMIIIGDFMRGLIGL